LAGTSSTSTAAALIGGHLRVRRGRRIYFVDRPFFGSRSCSVQFIDADGDAMFKVFVGRNKDRSLRSEQVFRFESLRDRMIAGV
jgi:putative heme iron utilization protein